MAEPAPTINPSDELPIAIRSDVLISPMDDGALFRDASESFILRGSGAYRFASALVAELTGALSRRTLVDAVPSRHREMATRFLDQLDHHGFLRRIDPGDAQVQLPEPVDNTFASQLAYLAHHRPDPRRSFRQVRTATVQVTGAGEVARRVVLGLARNGFVNFCIPESLRASAAVADTARSMAALGCPLELHTADTPRPRPDIHVVVADDRTISVLCETGLYAGETPVLPVAVLGDRAYIGPFIDDAQTHWSSVLHRVSDDLPTEHSEELWRSLRHPGPVSFGSAATQHHLAIVGESAAFEVFRHIAGSPRSEADGGVLIFDLTTLTNVVVPYTTHPNCVTGPGPESPDELLPESSHDDEESVEADYGRAVGAQGIYLGVLGRFDDLELEQLPLKVGSVRMNWPRGRSTTCFDIENTRRARLAALKRAAAVYTASGRHVRPVDPGGRPRIEPLSIVGAYGAADEHQHEWVTALRLGSSERRLLPLQAAYPFAQSPTLPLFERTIAGDGVGRTLGQAAGEALVTAAAWFALRNAFDGRAEVGHVSARDWFADDTDGEYLLDIADMLDADPELIAVPGAVPVVVAHHRGRWSVGTGLSGVVAAHVALRDLVGGIQVGDRVPGVATGSAWIEDGHPSLLAPQGSAPPPPPFSHADVLAQLARVGISAWAHRATPPDLASAAGLECIRVTLVAE